MKKRHYLVFLILLAFFIAGCENLNDIKKSPSQNINIYKTEVFSQNKVSGVSDVNFEDKIKSFLSLNYNINTNELKLEKTIGNANNKKFVYYTQEYNGIPVYNSRSVFLIRNNNLDYMKLNYYDLSNFDTTPSLSQSEVMNKI